MEGDTWLEQRGIRHPRETPPVTAVNDRLFDEPRMALLTRIEAWFRGWFG